MIYIAYTVHIVISIFLILVVLLQQGKGADLSVFGGGSTQTAFGARSATTLLHKLTVTAFVLFIVTTMSIGILQGGSRASMMSDVLDDRLEDLATPEAPGEEAAEPDLVEEPPVAPAAPLDQGAVPADAVPADAAPPPG